jgi:hypothetical protein
MTLVSTTTSGRVLPSQFPDRKQMFVARFTDTERPPASVTANQGRARFTTGWRQGPCGDKATLTVSSRRRWLFDSADYDHYRQHHDSRFEDAGLVSYRDRPLGTG